MTAFNENYMKRITGWLVWPIRLLLVISIAAAIIPMSPGMPGPGLDASWVYGLGEAVRLKLAFGKDMVFTLGPYASMYTSSYHPATYHFVLFGSTCMALAFSVLLMYLLAGRTLLLSMVMVFFLACSNGAPDATLMLYPLLLSIFIYKITLTKGNEERLVLPQGPLGHAIVLLLFGVLGLIPLIKGSMLILAVAIGGLGILRLFATGYVRQAIIAALACITGLFVFWAAAGQSLLGLPAYFINMLPIASGYTEAMSVKGKSAQITTYLIPCIVSAITILLARSLAWRNRLYLLATFGLFFFIAFKAGFVRQDTHVAIAGNALFLGGISLCIALTGRTRWIGLGLCALGWFAICNVYYPVTVPNAITTARNGYTRLIGGLWTSVRGTRNLAADFESARDRLRREHPIPRMSGTSDIYPFDQSYLIASDNTWSPRPVFQSYSAYTPKLAEMNRAHLLGPASPDNVIFSLQPIDMRLPSLDDGPSWPVLMSQYKPVRYNDGFVYLEKRKGDVPHLKIVTILEHDYNINQTVSIPTTGSALYVNVMMKRTLLGRLQGILFKPEELHITVTLLDGTTRIYRYVPGMGEAGFVLSPLIENASDFLLSYGSSRNLENKRVTSIRIWTKSKHPLSWAGYHLKLDSLEGMASTDINSIASVVKPVEIAAAGQPLNEADCFGSVDYLNGSTPTDQGASYSPILSIQGWIAESREAPGDDSFVATLTTDAGETFAAPLSRSTRPDVAAYFKSAALGNSGYQAFIDIGDFKGTLSVGLARKIAGSWVACKRYHYPLTLRMNESGHPKD